jgi:hypothetical protein
LRRATMSEEKEHAAEEPVVRQQDYVPKPPSPEAIKEISRQQELITDEWSGEEQPRDHERGRERDPAPA